MNRGSKIVNFTKNALFQIGAFTFDFENQTLILNNQIKRLTKTEADVLQALCNCKNQIIKRENILLSIWGDNDYFMGRSLDVFIAKLRKYLKEDQSIKIENIPRVGYILSDNTNCL